MMYTTNPIPRVQKVKEDDEWILFVIRYQKDIEPDGVAVNSAFGFKNEDSAREAGRAFDAWLDGFMINGYTFYRTFPMKKENCFFDGRYWKPNERIIIDPIHVHERNKVL